MFVKQLPVRNTWEKGIPVNWEETGISAIFELNSNELEARKWILGGMFVLNVHLKNIMSFWNPDSLIIGILKLHQS